MYQPIITKTLSLLIVILTNFFSPLLMAFIIILASASSSSRFFFVDAAGSYVALGNGDISQLASMYYDGSRDLILVSSYNKHIILTFTVEADGGTWTTIAGVSSSPGTGESTGPTFGGTTARFNTPKGIAGIFPPESTDKTTGWMISDYENGCLKYISATSPFKVTTAGGVCGSSSSQNGIGSTARLKHPQTITFLQKSRYLAVGQQSDDCVRLAKPTSEDEAGYLSLDVQILAGACSDTSTSFNVKPLLARFDNPGFVAGTIEDILYFAERTGNLYRLAPATGIGDAAVLTDLGAIPLGGGHLHNLAFVPLDEGAGAPLTLFAALHNGPSTFVKLTESEVQDSSFTTPTWSSSFESCVVSTSSGTEFAVLPNGTIIEGDRTGPSNLKQLSDCSLESRPKSAYWGGGGKRTRTETLPTKTGTKTASISNTTSVSNTATLTTSISFSDTASVTNSRSSTGNTATKSFSGTSSKSVSRRTFSLTKTESFSKTLTPSSTPTRGTASSSLSSSSNITTSISRTPIPTSSLSSSFLTSSFSEDASTKTISLSEEDTVTPTSEATPTISLPVPASPKVVPTPALGQAAFTATAVLGLVVGAPAVAATAAKLQAAIQLSNCGQDPTALESDMEFLANPFGARFGRGPILQSQRAAAALNVFFIGIFAFVIIFAAFVLSLCSERNFKQSLSRVRFPGIVSIPLAVILPGTTEASSSLWFYSNSFSNWSLAVFATMTVVIGPFVLIALTTLPGWCRAVLQPIKHENSLDNETDEEKSKMNEGDNHNNMEQEHLLLNNNESIVSAEPSNHQSAVDPMNAHRSNNNNNNIENDENDDNNGNDECCSTKSISKHIPRPVVRFWYWLTVASFEWFDQNMPPPLQARKTMMMKGDVNERGEWSEKYCASFEDFTISWAVLIDLFAAMFLGWAAGVAAGSVSRPKCLMWLSAATSISFAHTYFFIVKRPVLTRLRLYFMVFASIITSVTVFLATLQFLGQVAGFNVAAGAILDIQVVVGFLAAIIEGLALIVFVIEVWDAYISGRDAYDAAAKNRNRNFAIFDNDDFLTELENRMAENNNNNDEADDDIDLGALLSGEDNNNKDHVEVDLTGFLDEEDEEMVLDIDDDEADEDILLPPLIEEEEKEKDTNNNTDYALEDDEDNDQKYSLDDQDEDGQNGNDQEGDGKVGSAQTANAQQLKELREMMEKSKQK